MNEILKIKCHIYILKKLNKILMGLLEMCKQFEMLIGKENKK